MSEKLIYLALRFNSAAQSQALPLLNHFVKAEHNGQRRKAYWLIGVVNANEKARILAALKNRLAPEVHLCFFDSVPLFWFTDAMHVQRLAKKLQALKIDHQTIIHARGEVAAYLALLALDRFAPERKKQLLLDVRGAMVEEIRDFSQNRWLQPLKLWRIHRFYEKLPQVGAVSAVSEALRDYLFHRFSLEKSRVSVIPCLASQQFYWNEERRKSIREELFVGDDELLVLLSVGGDNAWQNIEFLAQALARNGVKALFLTPKKIDLPQVICRFVAHEKVPDYLNAADVGLLWRDKHVINQVASPIKFSEYLAAGLPVLANGSVEMVNQVLSDYPETGIRIAQIEEISSALLERFRHRDRQKIAAIGQKLFSIDTVGRSYAAIYKQLQK
ncbi:glycosyltransferase [Magnetococcales bacterium HHB-1]